MWSCLADVWTLIEELDQKGVKVQIKKVKAHTDDDQLAPLPVRLGKLCADHHVGHAVEELPAGEVASIKSRDRQQRAIQECMILALQMLSRRVRHPWESSTVPEASVPKTKRNSRIGPAKVMQLVVKRRGCMLECERCCLFWLSA